MIDMVVIIFSGSSSVYSYIIHVHWRSQDLRLWVLVSPLLIQVDFC